MKTRIVCLSLVIMSTTIVPKCLSAPRLLLFHRPEMYDMNPRFQIGDIAIGQYEIVNPYNVPISFSLSFDGKNWKDFELKPKSNESYKGAKTIRFCDDPANPKSLRTYSLGNSDRYVFTFGDGHYDFKILAPRK